MNKEQKEFIERGGTISDEAPGECERSVTYEEISPGCGPDYVYCKKCKGYHGQC